MAAEFGVVEAKDDLLRGVDHGALDVDEQAVRIANAVQRDSATAHDGDIGVNLGKRFDREGTHEHAEPRINHAAGNNNFNAVRGSEEIRDRQRIGDDLRRLFFQITRDVINGGAGVDDHALIWLDQLGAGFADGFFFRELMRFARS